MRIAWDRTLDGVGRQGLPAAGNLRELVDEPLGQCYLAGGTAEGDHVAAHVDVDPGEPGLDGPEDLVALPETVDVLIVGSGPAGLTLAAMEGQRPRLPRATSRRRR